MAGPGDYTRALSQARRTGFAVQAASLNTVEALFQRMLIDLGTDSRTGAIGAARAAQLERQVRAMLRSYRAGVVATTDGAISLTMERIVTLHAEATTGILGTSGAALDLAAIEPRVLAVMASVRRAETFVSLLDYRLDLIMGEVDNLLRSAVARGVSSGRASVDMARLLASGNRRMETALRKLPRTFGGSLDKVRLGAKDFSRYGIDRRDTRSLRTLLYDSRRIVRSETMNTMRETNAVALNDSPVVEAGRWQTSGNHPEEDECDELARADAFGLGPGFYPPDQWPFAPHPHCGCYQAGVKLRSPTEWSTPKPTHVVDPSRLRGVEPKALAAIREGIGARPLRAA